MRWGFAGIACSVLVLTSSASGFVEEPLAPGTLSGTLIDPDGKPVAGAKVWTLDYRHGPDKVGQFEARTGGDGRFRLGPLGAGYLYPYDIVVESDFFARRVIPAESVSIDPGRNLDLGTILLERGRVFTGTVLDVNGDAMSGLALDVKVARLESGHGVRYVGPTQVVETDRQGRFRTPPLPTGRLSLSVQVPERRRFALISKILTDGEEDLGVLHLEGDVPVAGTVVDEFGKPVPLAAVGGTVGLNAVTDGDGQFTLHGLGPNPSFQLRVTKRGYAELLGRVTGTEAGLRYDITQPTVIPGTPSPTLVMTLERAGSIEGRAVDDETGAPIRVTRVQVAAVLRQPDGDLGVVGSNRSFPQSDPDRFQASFAQPGEYRLTLSAAGYHDAETFTPKVDDNSTIEGIVVRMKKRGEASKPTIPRQSLAGSVARDGRPVTAGWVGLWTFRGPASPPNAPVLQGRMIGERPVTSASAPIREGSYHLDVPFPGENWYVVVDEPGRPITQVGPVAIAPKAEKKLDIACQPGGEIRGQARGIPAEWAGHAYVVAFNRTGVRAEAPVDHAGGFALPPLPPGEYGLKVGHDAYEDAETYPGLLARQHPESSKLVADPWKQAKVVTVAGGQTVDGVEVVWPE